ncbi:glycoside hydrolase family 2 TIM barrel-domain containing protein [Terrabacter sp. MAHUQ-38]|uniref:glycoside hydrolase family 2 TIM barrel-domain containing protein n=1 Tax=unclassified Terrabacter TaxID=2630222 RepID=UPI00165DAEBE|nr:glycoside hydrolase family 2 TIM barrel-domain containing protein [Terrabacter sp. MAHUQ-38]MBC9823933.1 glycoside hydrolase family 2 protein [Terrabacter sp. MAHUQ-38]
MLRQPFNGDWRFGPFASVHAAIVFDGPDRDLVTLPHDAMLTMGRSADHSGGPALGYFRGGNWTYEKSFHVPREWALKRVTFEFEGVYRNAMVYINGVLAGQWAYGYTGFHISADPHLKYGQTNTIRVDARAQDDSRWYSGGGIYRPVHLLIGELVHIVPNGIRVTTPDVDADLATVAVATRVINEDTGTRTVQMELLVRDDDGNVVASDQSRLTLRAGEAAIARQRAYIRNPSLWNVDSPRLYEATVRLHDDRGDVDEARSSFGIRTVTADPIRGLRINGETIKLRGAGVHHDNGVLGAADFADASERRVRKLKAAGFNAIRSAHNPLSVSMLEACDRLGMLVMDEAFDAWTFAKSDDDYSHQFLNWWERDIDAMVAKDVNHPSVIMYSIGNEIIEAGTTEGARLGRQLAERVRANDPTRLVTHALQGMYIARDEIASLTEATSNDEPEGLNEYLARLTDLVDRLMASDVVGERLVEPASVQDVVGLNYGDSRYVLDKGRFPNRVVVGSETFPTKIAHLWKLVTENAHVIGDFTWIGWDFLGEAGTGRPVYPEDEEVHRAPYPWLTIDCGDLDITGQRLPISYYRELVYGLTDTPYLAVAPPRVDGYVVEAKAWTWTDTTASWTWDTPVGSPVHVEAYATGTDVEFRLNGDTVATVAVGSCRELVAEAQIPYQPGVLEAISYRDGQEVGRCALRTAAEPAHLSVEVDRSDLAANNQHLVHVELSLVDDGGVVNPIRDRQITIEVDGPAVLQGFGTGAPSTVEPFLDHTSTTYRGRALAVIRATGDTGQITVRAVADGLPEASLEINVT